ncbi:G_PROTEIN_RECEP_F1_2 domain-containing protein [Meloidogyne graminicola]|uniref:G_PROTEIN_RECEP_F1_2 domain-containing protein n=1 Tax=Meloidogyne graminicola TaxID=189291 RepID=A0A8S9ZT04_9BILA|nr:G_PROTEIN_RECEP_F1_2 domain-containing protein [Meloidogyne graminicola]
MKQPIASFSSETVDILNNIESTSTILKQIMSTTTITTTITSILNNNNNTLKTSSSSSSLDNVLHPIVEFPSSVEIKEEEILLQNCFESDRFVQFQYTMDDLLLAASTGSTLFNLLVIFCAFRLFKRSGDTMHIFIINMTVGDLLLTVFCHPNEFLIRKHAFLRHVQLCAIIHYCNWLGLAVSGLSLTLLNIDKLIYFRWPLSYERAMSKRRAICLCIGIWAISLGFVSYVWFENIVFVTTDCMLQMADNSKYFYEIFMILFCVLPVSSSLVVSTYLFRLTKQKLNSPIGPTSQAANVDMPTFKSKLKSLVFIFATTAWTSFSLLPYRIFNICRIHLFDWPNIGCEQRVIMNWIAWILLYLLILNPIVNPLITTLIYAPYRLHLKRLLLHIPRGNRLNYSTYTRTGGGGGDVITEHSQITVRRGRHRRNNNNIERNNSVNKHLISSTNNKKISNNQNQSNKINNGYGDSSTTTSTSSRHLPINNNNNIPLVNIDGISSNKREFSSSVDVPLSAKSSIANSSINSSNSKSVMLINGSSTISSSKFVFVDEEENNEEEN